MGEGRGKHHCKDTVDLLKWVDDLNGVENFI
jgi:hypothetical protein